MRSVAAPLVALFAFTIALPFLTGMVSLVHFTGERIEADVFPGYVNVRGLYTYRNPWPIFVRQGFWLPLPVDDNHPDPALVTINRLDRTSPNIPVVEFDHRYWFELAFRPQETSLLEIIYRQKANIPQARYILTTTRPWRRPLAEAEYRLTPHGVRITGSNYPLSETLEGNLGFDRRGFMPAEDWIFNWEVTP